MLQGHIREANVANLSLLLQPGQRLHGGVKGYSRIGNVQLENVDLVKAQPLQTALHRGLQMLRTGIMDPLPGADTFPTAFGANHQAGGIGRQRLGDEFLRDVGTIGVRRVNEVDPQFDYAAQGLQSGVAIRGRPPDAFAGDAHGAVSQAIDDAVSELDGPGVGGRDGWIILAHALNPLFCWAGKYGTWRKNYFLRSTR